MLYLNYSLALSRLFGLSVLLLENQNVATGWFSLKKFSWILFFLMITYIWAKNKQEEISKKYRAQLNTKKILIYVVALNKIYIYLFFWYLDVLYTSQVFEVVRNGKNSIFLLILLNWSPNKSSFNENYPTSVPSRVLIISLSKNDKMLVLAKISFFFFFFFSKGAILGP